MHSSPEPSLSLCRPSGACGYRAEQSGAGTELVMSVAYYPESVQSTDTMLRKNTISAMHWRTEKVSLMLKAGEENEKRPEI